MKNFIVGLLIGSIAAGCAGIVIPILDNRTLLIDQETAGLMYPHCKDYPNWLENLFGKDKCKNFVIDKYDLTKLEVRQSLSSFVCIHEKRIQK